MLVCCSVLQCVAACCNVMHCFTVLQYSLVLIFWYLSEPFSFLMVYYTCVLLWILTYIHTHIRTHMYMHIRMFTYNVCIHAHTICEYVFPCN